MITYLPCVIPAPHTTFGDGSPEHPLRILTRAFAFEPDAWTRERRAELHAKWTGQAAGYADELLAGRECVLRDALDRRSVGGDRCAEVGCGIGASTPFLAARFPTVVATDLVYEMVRRVTADAALRLAADAQHLPLPAGWADVIVLHNAFLFPQAMDRLLASTGALVWVSLLGDRTPIYLSAEDVARAMPGDWSGVASEAGPGTWCVLHRGRS